MNRKAYRLIYDKSLNALRPVAEFVISRTESGSSQGETTAQSTIETLGYRLRKAFLAIAMASMIPISAISFAQSSLPTDGSVNIGAGSIGINGSVMTINQASQRLGINWQSFSVGVGNTVNFVQPNANAVALNRVIGNNRSEIFGTINANGKVFLINQNGIIFGKTAEINAGSFVASTKDISDDNFLADKILFSGNSVQEIINQGNLKSVDGYIVLSANRVINEKDGLIKAKNVSIGAGEKVEINVDPYNQIKIEVSGEVINALIENKGLISADNGSVYLTARGKELLTANAINIGGAISAKSGTVVLDGGDSGIVKLDGGTVNVSSDTGKAGAVILSGQYVGVINNATIDASGKAGGGRVIIGGDKLNKARDVFNTRFADKAIFDESSSIKIGSSNGDGGFVETSGKEVDIAGTVIGASKGTIGQWLIDPVDIEIVNGSTAGTAGSMVTDGALSTGSVGITLTTDTSAGKIMSDSNVVVTGSNAITFNTSNNVNLFGTWSNSGGLNFNTGTTAGISRLFGTFNTNVTANVGELRLQSIANVDSTKTVFVNSGANYSIYTSATTTSRTINNRFVLNGGTIKTGGTDDLDTMATGGVIRSDGTNIIHIYTSNGTFSSPVARDVNYLLVGGGGGGGRYSVSNGYGGGGGGGAGGMRTGTATGVTNSNVVVGAGGAGATGGNSAGANGANSSFAGLTALGGGAGGGSGAGATGGSGGGTGGAGNTAGGAGTAGQGNSGGGGTFLTNICGAGGGGGGAGGAGGRTGACSAGEGGIGLASSITGINKTYATGGKGGNGAPTSQTPQLVGAANTGNGGTGADNASARAGGAGIVALGYAKVESTACTTITFGGTIDLVGGSNTIDTKGTAIINGVVSGTGALTVAGNNGAGNSVVALTNTNTYTGGTTINTNAQLNVGVGGTTGTLGVGGAVVNNGNLVFNRSDVVNINNCVSGSGNIAAYSGGNVNMNQNITTTTGTITLAAGVNQLVGDVTGGTVAIAAGKLITTGATGTVNIFTNDFATMNTAAYQSKINMGSANPGYSNTEKWYGADVSCLSQATAGKFNIMYRRQPILAVTGTATNKTYDGTPSCVSVNYTSIDNSSTVDGDSFDAQNSYGTADGYHVGQHTITSSYLVTNASAGSNAKVVHGYNISQASLTANITKRTLYVNSTVGSKTYGQSDTSGSNYNLTSNFNYTIGAYNNTTNTGLVGTDKMSGGLGRLGDNNVGSYNYTVGNLTGTDANGTNYNDYNLVFEGSINKFTINKATVNVTAINQTKTYGQNDGDQSTTPWYTQIGLVNGNVQRFGADGASINDTITDNLTGVLGRNIGENVGTYGLTAGNLQANTSNYITNINVTNKVMNITKASTTVTLTNTSKTYGTNDATNAYNYTLSGFTGCSSVGYYDLGGIWRTNGSASVNVTGHAGRIAGENVGNYTVSNGSLNDNNLQLSFVNGNVEITKADLALTINNASKTWGDDDTQNYNGVTGNFSNTSSLSWYDSNGTLRNDGVANLSFTGNLGRVAGEDVNNYAIARGSVTGGGNFNIVTVNNGTLSISKRDISLSINNANKSYGSSDPVGYGGYSTNYTNRTNVGYYDTTGAYISAGNASLSLSGNLGRAAGENVNNYAIGKGSLTNNNVNLALVTNGTFTITKANITANVAGGSKGYGTSDQESFYNYVLVGAGFTNQSALGWWDIDGNYVSNGTANFIGLAGHAGRTAGENVGNYALNAGSLSDVSGNFNVVINANSNVSITKASATVTAIAQDKTYDGTANVVNASAYSVSGVATGSGYYYNSTGANVAVAFNDAVTGATLNYNTARAGTNRIIQVSAATGTGGFNANNYDIIYTNVAGTIAKKALTGAFEEQTKVYDTNTNAAGPVGGSGITGWVTGDNSGSFSGDGTYNSKNVWEAVNVTYSNVALTVITGSLGSVTDDYDYSGISKVVNGTITRANMCVSGSITAQNKTYDGTLAATANFSGLSVAGVGGETLAIDSSGATAQFADFHVNNNINITISNASITNGTGDVRNYVTATIPSSVTANITKRTLYVNAATYSKTYDGTVNMPGSGVGANVLATDSANQTGFATRDSANGVLSQRFNSTHVLGVNGSLISVDALSNTSITGGGYVDDYDVVYTNALGTVLARKVNITLTRGDTRTYDGSKDITGVAANWEGSNVDRGLVNAGDLSLTYDQSLVSKNANINQKVNLSNLSLANTTAWSSDYDISLVTNNGSGIGPVVSIDSSTTDVADASVATIERRVIYLSNLSGSFLASDKTYDGSRYANVTITNTSSGAEDINSQRVNYAGNLDDLALNTSANITGTFETYHAGTNINVSLVYGGGLTGADADNYDLQGTNTTVTANIAARSVTVTLGRGTDKVYDGTNCATVGGLGTSANWQSAGGDCNSSTSGLCNNGDILLSIGNATFANVRAKNDENINLDNVSVTNGSAWTTDYVVNLVHYDNVTTTNLSVSPVSVINATVADIQRRVVNITASSDAKTYDGTTTSAVNATFGIQSSSQGLLSGDDINLSQYFNTARALGLNNVTLSLVNSSLTSNGTYGSVDSDYDIQITDATGTINKRVVNVVLNSDSKTYDGTTTSAVNATFGIQSNLQGLLSGDDINLRQAFNTARALGLNNVTLSLANSSLTSNGTYGSVDSDYDVQITDATGTINKRVVNVVLNSDSKTYDGTTASTKDASFGTQSVTQGLLSGDNINLSQVFNTARALGLNNVTLSLVNSSLTSNGTYGSVDSDYDVQITDATGTINKRVVNITASSDAKTYDGTTTSSVNATFGIQSNLQGLLSGDDINLSQYFNTARALGLNNVTLSLANSSLTSNGTYGSVDSDYDVQITDATGTINKRVVNIKTVGADKTYDGTNSLNQLATYGNNGANQGFLSGDNINYQQAYSGYHAGKVNATIVNQSLTSFGSFGSVNADYDIVIDNSNSLSTISRRAVYLDGVTDSKTYDGSNNSNVNAVVRAQGTNNGLINGDVYQNVKQTFDATHAGTVNLNAQTNSGSFSSANTNISLIGDYEFVQGNRATGTIAKRKVFVDAVTDTKTYDGGISSDKSPIVQAKDVNSGLLSGDSINGLIQKYDSPEVGSRTLKADGSGANIASTLGNPSLNSDYDIVSCNTIQGMIVPKVEPIPETNNYPPLTLQPSIGDADISNLVSVGFAENSVADSPMDYVDDEYEKNLSDFEFAPESNSKFKHNRAKIECRDGGIYSKKPRRGKICGFDNRFDPADLKKAKEISFETQELPSNSVTTALAQLPQLSQVQANAQKEKEPLRIMVERADWNNRNAEIVEVIKEQITRIAELVAKGEMDLQTISFNGFENENSIIALSAIVKAIFAKKAIPAPAVLSRSLNNSPSSCSGIKGIDMAKCLQTSIGKVRNLASKNPEIVIN